jgi:transcriptional regulator with GAF, ATPase, and Fis domain
MYSSQLKSLCNNLLETGRDKFSMSMGIVSHIVNDRYEIIAASSTTGVFVAGEDFPLQDTYCRDVYEQQKTISFTELGGTQGLKHHPLYGSFLLEAYISAPIFVNNKVWGTINFSCMQIRDTSFTNEDIDFINNAATTISKEIGNGS